MLETTPNARSIEETVRETIAGVMAARDLDPGGIEPGAKLSETLGLRSMDLAQIVLTLEDDLETDPFQEIPITSIRTVGDLTQAYLVSLGLSQAAAPGVQDMAAEMEAAKARRARRRR
jgi:acyl carrier protein